LIRCQIRIYQNLHRLTPFHYGEILVIIAGKSRPINFLIGKSVDHDLGVTILGY